MNENEAMRDGRILSLVVCTVVYLGGNCLADETLLYVFPKIIYSAVKLL